MIGYGYWGPNLARALYDLPTVQLVAIADAKKINLNRARKKFPGVTLTTDYRDLFKMGLDGVIVSTPPKTHFPIAKDCMQHGLNTWLRSRLHSRARMPKN